MIPASVPTPHYSPLLHNAILSIALCYADEEHLRFPGTRKVFAQQAKTFIDQESSNPIVATVQGLASLSSYHSLEGEHNLGWTYMGQASRLSQARKSVRIGLASPGSYAWATRQSGFILTRAH